MYQNKRSEYSRAVKKAKKKFEEEMKKKLERSVHSPSFWRTAQQVGICSKRQKANLNCVVDENGDPRSGVEAGSVWKAYFEKLLNGGESTVSSDRARGDGQEATDWGHDL